MNKKLKRVVYIASVIGIILIVGLGTVVVFIARRQFTSSVRKEMEITARITRADFESGMNGQLQLVLQLMRMPSVTEYLKNPSDKNIRARAFEDLQTFKDAFTSKSVFWVSDVDKAFWSDMQFSYYIDPNNPDDYWYNMTMYETDVYNFNINYNPSLKVTNLWVNAVVKEYGKSLGMLGTGIPLTDMISSIYANLDDKTTMYLYNSSKEITGATDDSMLKKKLDITEEMPDLKNFEIFPTEFAFYSTVEGEYMIAPLSLVGWHMVLFRPFTMAEYFNYGKTAIIAAICALIVVIVLAIQIITMLNQLTILNEAVVDLSSGNADLTKRISIKNQTIFKVFSDVVDNQNKFIEKLQAIIAKIKHSEQNLNSVGNSMANSSIRTVSVMSDILANIQNVDAQINLQSDSVTETAGAVNQIAANINMLDNLIQEQTRGVSDASSAVEEMIGNIQHVNSSVDKMADSFSQLELQSQEGQLKQVAVNEKIQQIEEKSKMLQEANQAIANIANQTNLLAMNAAIEAAHAGASGKGFAVVADEIRKLSETSTQQSKTIGEQLKSIQESINEVVYQSNESSKSFTNVSKEINITNQIVSEIKNAMDEQIEGSNQIISTLGAMKNSTAEVNTAAKEMIEGNKLIIKNVDALQSSASQVKGSMDKMTEVAHTLNQTSSEIQDISNKIKGSISEIGNQIEQFVS